MIFHNISFYYIFNHINVALVSLDTSKISKNLTDPKRLKSNFFIQYIF